MRSARSSALRRSVASSPRACLATATSSPHDELVARTKKHNFFSWSAQGAVAPGSMVRAEGSHFWDANGKKWFDLNSQLMCSNLGHQDQRVVRAIQQQAAELCYAGPTMATRVRAEMGEELAKITPKGLDMFFFTLGGAEATENAIRMARAVTGRHKIVARYRSYHGSTMGSITLTGDHRRWANEPGIPGVVRIFDPYKYRSQLYADGDSDAVFSAKCLAQIEETLMYENPQSVAAFILETVTGTNGIIVPPDGYLQGLRALCDKHGILLICDEVMAGVGRTGEWFACDHWRVVPDLLCMAKGVTSAYMPLGVVAMNARVADHFKNNVYYGGLTYSGHPMSLAAGVATLRAMHQDKTLDHVKAMAPVLSAHLNNMKKRHPCVGDVRSIGMFGCLELVKNRKTKEPLGPFVGPPPPELAQAMAFLKDNGVYAFNWKNFLHTNPPLVATKKELDDVFQVIDGALTLADKAYRD